MTQTGSTVFYAERLKGVLTDIQQWNLIGGKYALTKAPDPSLTYARRGMARG